MAYPDCAVAPSSKATQLYRLWKDEISSGHLRPGDALTEKRSGFSQSSGRDAIARLRSERLLAKVSARETIVVNPTRKDVKNLCALRAMLEVPACQSAASHFDASDFAELERLAQEIPHSNTGDEAFHYLIWERCANPYLIEDLKRSSSWMFVFAPWFLSVASRNSKDRVTAHLDLIGALRSGDPQKIADGVRNHIFTAYDPFTKSQFVDLRGVALARAFVPSTIMPQQRTASVSLQRAYLRSIPALAVIRDEKLKLVYANEEFERRTGKCREKLIGTCPIEQWEPEIAEPIEMFEEVVRSKRTPILALLPFRGIDLITLRFPMQVGEKSMTGMLGFDLDAIKKADNPSVRRVQLDDWIESTDCTPLDVKACILTSFFQHLPAITTLKDSYGRMVWANMEYERVTGKVRDEAVGHLPTDNWPGSLGEHILEHDSRVRSTRKSHLTLDAYFRGNQELPRINVRFPIFDEWGQVEMTGSAGLDYELLAKVKGMHRLEYVELPRRDGGSIELSPVAVP